MLTRHRRGPGLTLSVLLIAGLVVCPSDVLVAQQPGPGQATGPGVPPADASVVTPGGAFLRAVLVPGWGHAATESYGRAGFYVATQAGSLWMLLQTVSRHSFAKDALGVARGVVRERALASIEPVDPPVDPEDQEAREAYSEYLNAISAAVDSDPSVERRTSLVESRDQQVEDWAAL